MSNIQNQTNSQQAEQQTIDQLEGQCIELGTLETLTQVYADGGNRDGGYVQGNNYSYN
ncbi:MULTISPECIES: hypothetical protein [Deefgea]|uniref:Benenodin family lasso peptide n=1 Tax=Deefgea chitinilytica TaxID=570276 RepID=A0ABS2CBP7_9NEIS|nr:MULTISPECIES: hypothetical protein [Deefgea]MBM5571575.1 hypothetical protein [Deefgea chitinilytica]MBM9888810.1 hypothetical protein [Deefgea sp. CFH1-16]